MDILEEPKLKKKIKKIEIGGAQQVTSGNIEQKERTQTTAVLPIHRFKEQIIKIIKENQVVVIAGQTGSGKTTQVPQFLYSSGFSSICISQPRRISAITLAKRVAHELSTTIGDTVGYSVRFQEKRSNETKIHFVTDGMAIRQLMLNKSYDIFILDEAHERSVNTDVLLAVLKKKLKKSRTKLVIMSATIDISKFLDFFNSDAYLNIQGRTYPIHLYYTIEPVADYVRAMVNSILQIHMTENEGDILAFLTGQQQILTVQKILKGRLSQPENQQIPILIVKTLFSAMPSELQLQAFVKSTHRKVILATNIAETSITIDGIKYVIDCGFCKMRLYDHQRNMDILSVLPVSKSSALQRAGRAGRQFQGKCYRLFNKNAYQDLPDYHLPEILRVDISNSLLQLKSIGVLKIKQFQFMDSPDEQAIDHALNMLRDINAIDKDQKITERGRELSQLPLPPEHSHLLLMSLQKQYDVADLMLSCIAILSVENLFYVPQKHNLLKVLKRYEVKSSDHLTKIHIFHQYIHCSNKKSFSKENYINSKNIKRAIEVREQLEDYLVDIVKKRLKKDVFLKEKPTQQQIKAKFKPVLTMKKPIFLKCLANAMANRKIARITNDGSYIIAHSSQIAKIHPQSLCFKNKPEVIVFSEIVKTQKVYLRDVSEIIIEQAKLNKTSF